VSWLFFLFCRVRVPPGSQRCPDRTLFRLLAAGSSNRCYGKLLIHNVAGAILWICILLTAGYLFCHALIQVTDFVEN
ncbi:hypothetical protein CHQ90_18980, partial [Acinetobacter baumannii]